MTIATIEFPPVEFADENGLLALGGNLEPETLLSAYSQGIFPWPIFDAGELAWFSPPERALVYLDQFHISRSLKRNLRSLDFELRVNTAFEEVIVSCASLENRADQRGTWITKELVQAYIRLHHLGHAHSVECWSSGELVGGLYGVAIGGMFAGESMFYRSPNASKFCLVELASYLVSKGVPVIDCQQKTAFLSQFGCKEIPREEFLSILQQQIGRDIALFQEFS